MELRGLAALCGKLNGLLDCQDREATDALGLFGLSRYLRRRGERMKAESACVAARDRGLPLPFDGQARRELAQMAKRRGEYAAAATMLEELLEDEECRTGALEELASYHERRTKDYGKALHYGRQGLQELRAKNATSRYGLSTAADQRRLERVVRRVARLEARLAKTAENSAPLLQRAKTAIVS